MYSDLAEIRNYSIPGVVADPCWNHLSSSYSGSVKRIPDYLDTGLNSSGIDGQHIVSDRHSIDCLIEKSDYYTPDRLENC